MEFVNQHNNISCLPTAVYMLSNNIKFKTIKNYCRKKLMYSMKTGGTRTDYDNLLKMLRALGHDAYDVPFGPYPGGMHKVTKFNKALICISSPLIENGHAIAWDGSQFFDPATKYNKPYHETKLINDYFMYGGNLMIIGIRVHPIQRFHNMIKFYSKLCYNMVM